MLTFFRLFGLGLQDGHVLFFWLLRWACGWLVQLVKQVVASDPQSNINAYKLYGPYNFWRNLDEKNF